MVDPSLLLKRSAFEKTFGEIANLRREPGFEFFLASSLVQTYLGPGADSPVPEYFSAGPDVVDIGEVISRLEEIGVTLWERPAWALDEFVEFYNALGRGVDSVVIQDILFDEWFFLTHESWLVARIKAPFMALVQAGELGVQLLNPIVRRTLKRDASHVVQSTDRMRALAKWIAVGGSPAVALLNPFVGVVATTVAQGFFLVDPPGHE